MGGIIILSTVGNDRSVTNCTCAVIAVGLMHRSLSWAKSKNPRLGAILDGTPLVVIKNGEWQTEVVREHAAATAKTLKPPAAAPMLHNTRGDRVRRPRTQRPDQRHPQRSLNNEDSSARR